MNTFLEDQSLAQKSISALQASVPFIIISVFLICNLIHPPLAPNLDLKTPLFLITIYYWSIFFPAFMPAWLAFTGGLLIDCFSLSPIGLHALIYTLLQKFIISQRIYLISQSFPIIWSIFILIYSTIIIPTLLIKSGNFSFDFLTSDVTISYAINIIVFPCIYTLLHASNILFQAEPPSPLERKKKNIILKKGTTLKS